MIDGGINDEDWSEMARVNLNQIEIPPSVLKMVSVSMAQVYRIVPIRFAHNRLVVAMSDPHNVNALDDLRFILNVEVAGAIASEQQINAAIERFYKA